MRSWWFNALPDDTTASRRRWWTRHARFAFAVQLVSVSGLWMSVTNDLPVLILLNFGNLVMSTRNVLAARNALQKVERLEALEAALAAGDDAALVRTLLRP